MDVTMETLLDGLMENDLTVKNLTVTGELIGNTKIDNVETGEVKCES